MTRFKGSIAMMNLSQTALWVSVCLLTTSLYAENTTKTAPAYGDNPNIFKVLAVKAQTSVQNTAEKVGAATERGIAKIKPTVDDRWKGTKEYTTEQAVIARDNTRVGIDKAVKKVKETKEAIVGTSGSNGVPIQRGTLSQNTLSNTTPTTTQPATTVVAASPIVQNQNSVTTAISPSSNTSSNNSISTTEPEIQRQSLPIQNSQPSNDSDDAGIPR